MRKIYRTHKGNKSYWKTRWDNVSADIGELNLEKYPGKYAEMVMKELKPGDMVLEAGCGTGRVLYHYLSQKKSIIGMDFIHSALLSIKKNLEKSNLVTADICDLGFKDSSFSAVLAFGLYHNLENNIEGALKETHRILKENGIVCASMRLDNIQNRITDYLAGSVTKYTDGFSFHKINLTIAEIKELFQESGFYVHKIMYVENMPFLYKFRMFRHKSHKDFDEKIARAEGYKLNTFAGYVQKILMVLSSQQFSNVAVVFASARNQL